MSKGIEWLKEDTEKRIKTIESDNISFVGSEYYDEGYIDGMRDVLYRIDQLDEPEVLSQKLPVIPQFVADWYESEGKRSSWWNWFYKWGRDEGRTELETKTIRWMQDYNEETFVDMFLHGYEVGEEQKYVVELPNPNSQMGRHKNVFLNKEDGKVFIDSASLFVNDITKYGQFALTEEEIKKDFEWAWKFAKPVEELEE